ncbi:MAG TPA: alpha/beta fold hydrolase [bacterium]|nr:alpha/beta fold hydrolase [bacterium]
MDTASPGGQPAAAGDPIPIVLVPGLLCTPRLYAEQLPALWRFGQVTVADHTRDDSIAGIARRLLAAAPPRFALVGLSMGGYTAFEVMRQHPGRVARLALLDTSALADTPAQHERRRGMMALAREGRFDEVLDPLFQSWVHRSHRTDAALRQIVSQMAHDTGPEAFVRQQSAIMTRPDSRPVLGAIRCPTLVLVGDGDESTPPDRAAEIAQGISGSWLITIPEAGHLTTLEQPERVALALTDWLRS